MVLLLHSSPQTHLVAELDLNRYASSWSLSLHALMRILAFACRKNARDCWGSPRPFWELYVMKMPWFSQNIWPQMREGGPILPLGTE